MKSQLIIVVVLCVLTRVYSQSCDGRCSVINETASCQCTFDCPEYDGGCCHDYTEKCLSCNDRCGEEFWMPKPCQCNNACFSHADCCHDYKDICIGGGVTDDEILALTEQLVNDDFNNVRDQITINLQGEAVFGEMAQDPLFTSVPPFVLSGPTYRALINVQDNYNRDVSVPEIEDDKEIAEVETFLDAVMANEAMERAHTFLLDHDIIGHDWKGKLNEIWFNVYPGIDGILGSSGFEHVFVGEIKTNQVTGFHNWVYFYNEEMAGNLNYEGYRKYAGLGEGKGEVVVEHFTWYDYQKANGSMFIGTSPEFELALYTICFLTRPNSQCPVQMNGLKFYVQTFPYKYLGKNLMGSAYPMY